MELEEKSDLRSDEFRDARTEVFNVENDSTEGVLEELILMEELSPIEVHPTARSTSRLHSQIDLVDGNINVDGNANNPFACKKILAQGVMDVALISANANQLQFVIKQREIPHYAVAVSLIGLSIGLQIIVGISLILMYRTSEGSVKDLSKDKRYILYDKFILIGVYLITIINIFLTTYAIIDPAQKV